ncbi:MAG: hypothetical protein KME30_31715 [Iphinoe sp. HA4291-MV1]|jgi:hypothetical protein|nr:hypothetical protein [Iphinoe sp. HA4291-MV1]
MTNEYNIFDRLRRKAVPMKKFHAKHENIPPPAPPASPAIFKTEPTRRSHPQ